MIETTTTFRRCADARYRNIGGEGIIVRQRAGEVLVVSDVGARVLDLLEAGASVSVLLAALLAEYDVDHATLERDVVRYVEELRDAGVIEPAAA